MKPNPSKFISTCIVAVLLLAGMVSARAAVSVVSATSTTNIATSLTIPSFNLGAGNCLVVMVSYKLNAANTTLPTVTYNGAALNGTTGNVLTKDPGNISYAATYWAINPTTISGDVVVTFPAATAGAALSAMSISQVGNINSTWSTNAGANATFQLPYTGTAGGIVVVSGIDNRSTQPTIAASTGGIFTAYTRRGWLAAGLGQGYGLDVTRLFWAV